MTNYLLAFRAPSDRTPAEGEDQAWGAWFASMGSALVDSGHRVQHTETLPAKGGSAGGDTVPTGYVVIAAEGSKQVVDVASGCPGLKSGVSVEVAETIDA